MTFLVVMLPVCFADSLSLTYDKNGNLLDSGDGITREYNSLNQLWKVKNSSSGIVLVEFTHHPIEERVWFKNVSNSDGSWKETVYYISKEFVKVVNTSGTYNSTYVYHDGQLVAELLPDSSKKYYHPDHLGSTTLVTDSSGVAIENTSYTPYGEILTGGSSRFDYEGKEYDSTISQYDFHFRGYKSEWGKFTQPDTLIQDVYDPQMLNRYAFERGNPYKYVDETGHVSVFSIIMGFIGLFMGLSFLIHFNVGIPSLEREGTTKQMEKESFEKNYGIPYDAGTSDVLEAIDNAVQNANEAQEATKKTFKVDTSTPPEKPKIEEKTLPEMTDDYFKKKGLGNLYNPTSNLDTETPTGGGGSYGGDRYFINLRTKKKVPLLPGEAYDPETDEIIPIPED